MSLAHIKKTLQKIGCIYVYSRLEAWYFCLATLAVRGKKSRRWEVQKTKEQLSSLPIAALEIENEFQEHWKG
jgi:hypothetical protein